MEIIIEKDAAALAERAAAVVFAELAKKPDLVLGLATGKTPLGLYERLRVKPDAFQKVRFFNLDEFFGLPPTDANSFNYFLHLHLIKHVKHDPKNLHLLRGDVKDLEVLAREVEEKIKAVGGIDVQILGIGRNGHIGFNEPGSSLGSRTRPKTLEASTRTEYASSHPPGVVVSNFAITMGVGTIMESRRLLMLASGAGKADIIREMVEGPVTAEVPASVLQMHPWATVILDESASAKLKRKDYYKWVFENKWRVGQK
ncbi:MAG: glucosamine-6-phosphate deaminase [Planctomycetaceae bacterium]|nr:glucosamine-6-phosphate deaminase [Planctomycetaceae bacterium]